MEVRQRGSSGPSSGPERGNTLLAPLPRLYRMIVVSVVLALGIGAGVLLTQFWDLPAGGVLVGSLAGLGVAYLLVHDFHHAPRPARVPRQR